MQSITPFLWFDSQAEQAAEFYVALFPNSNILNVSRYTEAGQEVHGREPGSAMTVEMELNGQHFTALNGGPGVFEMTGAVSFMIHCKDQAEVDHYWNAFADGSDPKSQQCGWIKDKFGVTWQVVPNRLGELLGDADPAKSGRAMEAMMKMKKLDIAQLEQAFNGQ